MRLGPYHDQVLLFLLVLSSILSPQGYDVFLHMGLSVGLPLLHHVYWWVPRHFSRWKSTSSFQKILPYPVGRITSHPGSTTSSLWGSLSLCISSHQITALCAYPHNGSGFPEVDFLPEGEGPCPSHLLCFTPSIVCGLTGFSCCVVPTWGLFIAT